MEVAGLHYVVNVIDVAYFNGLYNVTLTDLSVLEAARLLPATGMQDGERLNLCVVTKNVVSDLLGLRSKPVLELVKTYFPIVKVQTDWHLVLSTSGCHLCSIGSRLHDFDSED